MAALLFALSLSATRLISRVAARLSGNALATATTFLALLVLHVALFVVWSAVLFWWFSSPVIWIVNDLLSLSGDSPDFYWFLLGITHRSQSTLEFMIFLAFLPFSREEVLTLAYGGAHHLVFDMFSFLMNVAANGLRILLALAFLSSFVFRPLVQTPVSRLWAGVIESGKPIFAILFGAAGALITFFQAWLK